MAKRTKMTQKRNGVTLKTDIRAQIDAVNLDMKQFGAGESPYDQFMIYVQQGRSLSIARNDQLLDQENITDLYTVSNRPESFPDGHLEIEAFIPVGS